MEKNSSTELTNTDPEEQIRRRVSSFKTTEFKIIVEKQLTRMKFIAEVLNKAKRVNKHNEKSEIVNIDDILVEMAILQMKKASDVLVFYIRIIYRGKRWTVRRTFLQIKEFHDSLSKGLNDQVSLPNYEPENDNMYRRFQIYFKKINEEIKIEKDRQKLNFFLEAIYNLNEENKMGEVIKCGWARKKTGGRYKGNKVWNYLKTNLDCCWRHRFFIITEEGIGYTNKMGDYDFRDVLMFDHTLRVRIGIHYTGEKRGIILYTSSRRLKIKVKNHFELVDWLEGIIDSISKSPYCKKNRFSSFSPVRTNNWAKWYINAHDYYKDLAYDLEKAKDEIYITDWWMSPEVYLIRPIKKDLLTGPDDPLTGGLDIHWRLDQILKRKAEAGVKIFILLYREFEQALPNKSAYTQSTLMNLVESSDNIEVMRHPGNLIFLWSHHEKTVTIDQKVCYMGGLDLCYGRYDLDDYPLSDPVTDDGRIYFPGQDYSNVRIKDFVNVDNFSQCLIDKKTQPRMPWRDVAIKLKGLITKDITRHFIQYWNFAKIDIEGKKRKNFLQKKFFKKKVKPLGLGKERALTGKLKDGHKLLMQNPLFRRNLKKKIKSKKTDKEMNAPLIKEEKKMEKVKPKIIKPKLSKGSMKFFKGLKKKRKKNKKKKGNNFEDFLAKTVKDKDENEDFNRKKLTLVTGEKLPQIEKSEEEENPEIVKKKRKKGLFSKMFHATSILSSLSSQKLMKKDKGPISFSDFTCECQILRSAGHWSIGLRANQTEKSIQNAYIEMISNAEHFIYIENQFFVSSVSGNPVKNQIAEAIIKRIELAIEKEQEFKVCVFIPLLPGFEGGIDEKSGNVMRIQLGWEYHTINRGKKSILQRISKKTDNPSKYIRFFGLRNHGMMQDENGNPKPVTEIVYIHSKCLIIDDRIALIGSANINDRSMVGNRDSELAVVVKDTVDIYSTMGGKSYKVCRFAHRLRQRCFSGIFGFNKKNEDIVKDPLDPIMWEEIDKRVQTNTDIYRTVFGVYPDDTVFTVKGVASLKEKADITKYDELKDDIKGVGVDFPLQFLKNENLKKMKHFEFGLYLLPNHIFT